MDVREVTRGLRGELLSETENQNLDVERAQASIRIGLLSALGAAHPVLRAFLLRRAATARCASAGPPGAHSPSQRPSSQGPLQAAESGWRSGRLSEAAPPPVTQRRRGRRLQWALLLGDVSGGNWRPRLPVHKHARRRPRGEPAGVIGPTCERRRASSRATALTGILSLAFRQPAPSSTSSY